MKLVRCSNAQLNDVKPAKLRPIKLKYNLPFDVYVTYHIYPVQVTPNHNGSELGNSDLEWISSSNKEQINKTVRETLRNRHEMVDALSDLIVNYLPFYQIHKMPLTEWLQYNPRGGKYWSNSKTVQLHDGSFTSINFAFDIMQMTVKPSIERISVHNVSFLLSFCSSDVEKSPIWFNHPEQRDVDVQLPFIRINKAWTQIYSHCTKEVAILIGVAFHGQSISMQQWYEQNQKLARITCYNNRTLQSEPRFLNQSEKNKHKME